MIILLLYQFAIFVISSPVISRSVFLPDSPILSYTSSICLQNCPIWNKIELNVEKPFLIQCFGSLQNNIATYCTVFSIYDDEVIQINVPAQVPARNQYLATIIETSLQNKQLVIYGGINNSGTFLTDMWVYNIPGTESQPTTNNQQSWIQVNQVGTPGTRAMTNLCNIKNENLLLFGGIDSNNNVLSDIWIFNLSSSTWQVQTYLLISSAENTINQWDGTTVYQYTKQFSTASTVQSITLGSSSKCVNKIYLTPPSKFVGCIYGHQTISYQNSIIISGGKFQDQTVNKYSYILNLKGNQYFQLVSNQENSNTVISLKADKQFLYTVNSSGWNVLNLQKLLQFQIQAASIYQWNLVANSITPTDSLFIENNNIILVGTKYIWYNSKSNCNQKYQPNIQQCIYGFHQCNNLYSGANCEAEQCYASCFYNADEFNQRICIFCNNNGSCNGSECSCNSNYEGQYCQYQKCPNNCSESSEGGTCFTSFPQSTCICNEIMKKGGIDCSETFCFNTCSGSKGKCNQGECQCDESFTGNDCSLLNIKVE